MHRDPKQQELWINLRTRFGLGLYKDSFWSRTLKMFKKHWFRLGPKKYRKKHWFDGLGQKTYQKSIGFIDSVQKSIKKAMVLKIGQPTS